MEQEVLEGSAADAAAVAPGAAVDDAAAHASPLVGREARTDCSRRWPLGGGATLLPLLQPMAVAALAEH